MASFQARLVRFVTSGYLKSIDARTADVRSVRRRWHTLARFLRIARGVARRKTTIAGRHAEWLIPDNAPADKVILYLHGGAYIMGNCATHRQMVSYIANAAGVRALLPEYRLAPEHPFPAAIEDAVAVYRELVAKGIAPAKIVISGDSAGGGLSMATLITLRDAGDPLPAAAFLLSPWLDLAGTGYSMRTRKEHDPWFAPEDLPAAAAHYCDASQLKDPRVSPVYADLSGLPPLFIQVGQDEILLSDSIRVANGIKATGGEADVDVWDNMWHVFQAFVHQMPEARQAIDALGEKMRRALDDGWPSKS